MHRQWILEKITQYQPENSADQLQKERLTKFVQNNSDCFMRENLAGHITGSAWIIDPDFTQSLMTHHFKLDQWLQLGGHSDGDSNTLDVALREVTEESGLKNIKPFHENIFDIDIHDIPARPGTPEHLHYDVRFIIVADPNEPLIRQVEESNDLQWIPLEKVGEYNPRESIVRFVRKTQLLKNA